MRPIEFRRRIVAGHAVRVADTNLAEVAKWCGGHTWASAVVVPVVDGDRPGEQFAPPGTWVVRTAHGWHVWPDRQFRAEWAPQTGLPANPPAG